MYIRRAPLTRPTRAAWPAKQRAAPPSVSGQGYHSRAALTARRACACAAPHVRAAKLSLPLTLGMQQQPPPLGQHSAMICRKVVIAGVTMSLELRLTKRGFIDNMAAADKRGPCFSVQRVPPPRCTACVRYRLAQAFFLVASGPITFIARTQDDYLNRNGRFFCTAPCQELNSGTGPRLMTQLQTMLGVFCSDAVVRHDFACAPYTGRGQDNFIPAPYQTQDASCLPDPRIRSGCARARG